VIKVSTWNVNGVRARKADVLAWIARERPDVLCLQETKCSPDQVPEELAQLADYHGYWHGHKGYSGVALLLSRATFGKRPVFAHPEFDHETRIVIAEATIGAKPVRFASIYVPNGGKDFAAKVRFLDALDAYAQQAQNEGVQLILCGDLNVAKEARDVHPTLQKPEQIGQTPDERAQLERIISRNLVDLSRKFHPDDDRLFTWWAPWRNMRERNIGWRLDYVLPSQELASTATRCDAQREFGGSDHGPVLAEFDVQVQPTEGAEPEPTPPSRDPGQLALF
jgi:exodeoxyribonuclease-3